MDRHGHRDRRRRHHRRRGVGGNGSVPHGGFTTLGWPAAYRRYRANLGRGILLGLELLVAADIIGTVAVTPSLQNLAVLGLIVLIRTFLSFSLEVEIEGRWPWQRAGAEATGSEARTGERL
jgi:hypothetical protein